MGRLEAERDELRAQLEIASNMVGRLSTALLWEHASSIVTLYLYIGNNKLQH